MNHLMICDVGCVLGWSSYHCCLLRSAGSSGSFVVDEVASRGYVPMYFIQPVTPGDGRECSGGVVPVRVGPYLRHATIEHPAVVSVEASAPYIGELPTAAQCTLTHYNSLNLTEFVWDLAPATLHLNGSNRFTAIPNRFMKSCFNMETLTLPNAFLSITSIGANFCGSCTALRTLDLAPLRNTSTIGDDFMKVSGLLWLDLSPLVNVRQIGANFLGHCYKLSSIDLTPLAHITAIPDGFLCRCRSLEMLDLSPLCQLESIGSSVLIDCSSLVHVDMSSLPRLRSIGAYFLNGCSLLPELAIPRPAHVTQVGTHFVNDCKSLESVSLEGLRGIPSIPDRFLASCSALRQVDLSPLAGASQGEDFMAFCPLLSPR
jgi:hypothetical protein